MNCFGPSTYIRVSFALLIFHLLTLIVIGLRNETVAMYNEGCWCLKMLMIAGIFIGSFWIDNDPFFLKGYMGLACIMSLGFLIFLALYMILAAFSFNAMIAKNIATGDTCSMVIGVVFLVAASAANITWIVFMFINFAGLSSLNLIVIIVSAASVLIMHVIQLFEFREDASLFTSALASLYVIWL